MMKNNLNSVNNILFIPLLLLPNTPLSAALTAELKVTGTISAPTCSITAQDEGIYYLETSQQPPINNTHQTRLPSQSKEWKINCDQEAYLIIKATDNRHNQSHNLPPHQFSLGSTQNSNKIGHYTAVIKNPRIDTNKAKLFSTDSSSFTASPNVMMNKQRAIGWASYHQGIPQSGKVFSADIEINPVLSNELQEEESQLMNNRPDGSMTLNFAFGI